jgi:acyl dehydratase
VSMAYYYEDFAIGQRFSSNTCRMDKERMMAFAAEFDPQPQHISERNAECSQFGSLVASGWHTAAVSMHLFIAEALPPIAGGGQGLGVEALSWPHPVRPGDELRVVTEVTGTRPSRSRPDKGLVTVRNTTTNQHGEVVQTLSTTIIVPRKKN